MRNRSDVEEGEHITPHHCELLPLAITTEKLPPQNGEAHRDIFTVWFAQTKLLGCVNAKCFMLQVGVLSTVCT